MRRSSALLLLLAGCTNVVGLAPHQWVRWNGIERQPPFACLCVAPSHDGSFTSVSIFGDTLTGHLPSTDDEWDDCRTQTRQ